MKKDEASKILITYRNQVLNPVLGSKNPLNSKLYNGLEGVIKTYVKGYCNEDKRNLAKDFNDTEFIDSYPTIGVRTVNEIDTIFHLGKEQTLKLSHLKELIEMHNKGELFMNLGKNSAPNSCSGIALQKIP